MSFDSNLMRNCKGGLEWGFADKIVVCRYIIRTDLFVISNSGEPTNPLTTFYWAWLTGFVTFFSASVMTRRSA